MAERFVRTFTDDLDGKPIDDGFEQQVSFSYRGANYQIDLRPKNADKLDAAFAPSVQPAQKIGASTKRSATPTPARTAAAPRRSPEQLQAIRDWASKNGYEVSKRGRIKQSAIVAFDATH